MELLANVVMLHAFYTD